MLWINLAGLVLIIGIIWWFRLFPDRRPDQSQQK